MMIPLVPSVATRPDEASVTGIGVVVSNTYTQPAVLVHAVRLPVPASLTKTRWSVTTLTLAPFEWDRALVLLTARVTVNVFELMAVIFITSTSIWMKSPIAKPVAEVKGID